MSILHTIEPRRVMDWEHAVNSKIEEGAGVPGFPDPEDYGLSDDEVRDYVYDKQRVLDRGEERRKSLVVPGIILVMPVIVMSAFGEGVALLLAGVVAGVVLMLAYFLLADAVDKAKLKRLRDDTMERYIQAVMDFDVNKGKSYR